MAPAQRRETIVVFGGQGKFCQIDIRRVSLPVLKNTGARFHEARLNRMMKARSRGPLRVVAVMLNLWTTPASAGSSPTEAFQAFGLFGTWSPDCARAPAADNPRVTWQAIGGTIVHTVTFDGRTPALVDFVASAEILAPDLIRYSAIRGGRVALIITVRRTDEQIRTERSQTPDGHLCYDNAVEVSTGRPALVDEKCVAAIS